VVPVGLRKPQTENVFLKLVGWTLWSFTLMLGALFVFNKYFSSSSAATNIDTSSSTTTTSATPTDGVPGGSSGGDGEDSSHEGGDGGGVVDNVLRLGFRNAGSWLLSTSAMGILAQLFFALPRIAAVHSVRLDACCGCGCCCGRSLSLDGEAHHDNCDPSHSWRKLSRQ
jgi:hypothetical protein